MKHETLVKRYKNIGYTPMELPKELELDNIIQWIWQTYGFLITVRPVVGMERDMNDALRKKNNKQPLKQTKLFAWNKFTFTTHGNHIENNHPAIADKAKETTLEAKHEAVKDLYAHLKFRYH